MKLKDGHKIGTKPYLLMRAGYAQKHSSFATFGVRVGKPMYPIPRFHRKLIITYLGFVPNLGFQELFFTCFFLVGDT
jgi:hypothetical protein